MLQRLASTNPSTLACMHGSAWHGDGTELLLSLAEWLVHRLAVIHAVRYRTAYHEETVDLRLIKEQNGE